MSVSCRSVIDNTKAANMSGGFDAGSCPGGERQWLMCKNCSFSPRQVLFFYLSLTAFSFLFAAIFAMQGLWLVLPFAVVENMALAAALLYYARHALDREYVALAGDELHVCVTDGVRITHHCFNAHWVRLEWRGRREDALWLCQSDLEIPLGIYLVPDKRRAFARELRAALRAQPLAAQASAPQRAQPQS